LSTKGVGNWIADEVLYQARVHPARLANSLSREESDAVHFQTHTVCKVPFILLNLLSIDVIFLIY